MLLFVLTGYSFNCKLLLFIRYLYYYFGFLLSAAIISMSLTLAL